jgi:phytoene dehydrogenase-like protein
MSTLHDRQRATPPTRDEVREIVEENWRQFLTFAAQGSRDLGEMVITRFDERTRAIAATMAPDRGRTFLAMVEEERARILDEYTYSPDALKRRLGVTGTPPKPGAHSKRQGMGEMVAKTAVRASIWAIIWNIFR